MCASMFVWVYVRVCIESLGVQPLNVLSAGHAEWVDGPPCVFFTADKFLSTHPADLF